MLPKLAQISNSAEPSERRRAERRVISFGFDAGRSQSSARILILDISRTGALLQTSADLGVGEIIDFDIPEAGLVKAVIVRRTADNFGVEFMTPVSSAVVSAVLLASPAKPPILDEFELEAARRSVPTYDPVPEWLMWTVMLACCGAIALFIFALGFLPVTL